jgi:hypothetical protein
MRKGTNMPKSPPKSAKIKISKQAGQSIAEALTDILDVTDNTFGRTLSVKRADEARDKITRLRATLTPKPSKPKKR